MLLSNKGLHICSESASCLLPIYNMNLNRCRQNGEIWVMGLNGYLLNTRFFNTYITETECFTYTLACGERVLNKVTWLGLIC